MNRRALLRGLGAAGVGLAGAGLWRVQRNHVFGGPEGPAYAPWKEWQTEAPNPLERLVYAAILAANPHNSQAWKFRLMAESIDVYADRSRQIGVIDPLLREMHIGIGCAVENLLLSAEAAGYGWSLAEAPATENKNLQPMVRVELRPGKGVRASELYAAIPNRHTNRGAYVSSKEIDDGTIGELSAARNSDVELRVFWFRKADEKRAFGDLVVRATEAIIADEEQSQSSARWLRTSWSEVQRLRDGLTYDAQGMSEGMRALAKFMPTPSRKEMDRFWLAATRESHVATASAFGIIAVRDAANLQQRVEAGRLWQRMHLLATARGVAMHPLNQMTERRDREQQLGGTRTYAKAIYELQQDDRWQAVMPFRMGYATQAGLPSPRRAAQSVLV